jgi:hypothetical protein
MPGKEGTMPSATPVPSAAGRDAETCLIGATRLPDFLAFVQERVVDGATQDREALCDLWREAASHFEQLQGPERFRANDPEVLPLPPAMQAHVDRLLDIRQFRDSFSLVPVAFGLVPLDGLVVYQNFITHSTVDAIAASLPAQPDEACIARCCLPLEAPAGGLRLARREGDRFVFICDNHDARFLGAQLLDPAQVRGLGARGHAACVLALPFGFTTNVVNVVRYGTRMVLNNGYHRLAALREHGITHAPCVIQVCAHEDDLTVAGAGLMQRESQRLFGAARPPLFADFFDPALARRYPTWALRKEIRVTFQVDTIKLAV